MAYADRRGAEPFFDRSRLFWISCSICSRERLVWLARLYESRQPELGYWQRTFTIITTRANRLVEPIHDRMPVIFYERPAENRINPGERDRPQLKSLRLSTCDGT
jgi:putative SOS response-associated peptidase YedK